MYSLFSILLILIATINRCFGFYVLNGSDPLEQIKIINGKDTDIAQIPYQVSLQRNTHHSCGGSIISRWHVLTAAHCINKGREFVRKNITVVSGVSDLKVPKERRRISAYYIHSGYRSNQSEIHDIALIKVDRPFVFSDTVKPVQLPKSPMPLPAGTKVTLSGWGDHDKPGMPTKSILQSVNVTIYDQKKCKRIMITKENNEIIHPTQFCTYNSDRKGIFRGDSGSPVTLNGTLVGIPSWIKMTKNDRSADLPQVFTRVSRYIKWINKHIAKLDKL